MVDLGVMVPRQEIVDAAVREKAGLIGLSGLIYPSLEEMGKVAEELEKRGLTIPLMVGGAATSKVHTALKLAPRYPSGMVIHVGDASQDAVVANTLFSTTGNAAEKFRSSLEEEYAKIRLSHESSGEKETPVCREKKSIDFSCLPVPEDFLLHKECFSVEELEKVMPWKEFIHFWGKKLPREEEEKLISEGKKALKEFKDSFRFEGVYRIFPAVAVNGDILLTLPDGKERLLPILAGEKYSLADYIAPAGEKKDALGFFALTCGKKLREKSSSLREKGDDYTALLLESLSLFLAESCAELLHKKIMVHFGSGKEVKGIRPAPGYPALPDHTLKKDIFELLDVEKELGITLTPGYMMFPEASIAGFVFAHPDAEYQAVGVLPREILEDYAAKRGLPLAKLLPFLSYME